MAARHENALSLCRIKAAILHALAAVLIHGALAGAGHAQSLDPELLRQLQQRAGTAGNRPVAQPSLVDESRENGSQDQDARQGPRGVSDDPFAGSATPSRIEEAFDARYPNAALKQFGYDIFDHLQQRQQAVTGRVGDDYVLGVGDELAVIFQGSEQANLLVKVDREGRIVAGKLPPVNAAGRPLGDVRRELESRTRETLLGTEVFVSLGAVRTVSVFVLGEVRQPGVYQLTSLTDVLGALAHAGGVQKTGSLRNIRLRRGDSVTSIDLYALLLHGEGEDALLRDGDRIVVPVIGPVIGIAGDVRRPAIYELAPGTQAITAGNALALAGGTLFDANHELVRGSFAQHGGDAYTALDPAKGRLTASDLLIVRQAARRPTGRAYLAGAVTAPGTRALAAAPSVSALIGSIGGLKMDAYLPFAALLSSDPATNAQNLIALNLRDILDGHSDRALQSEDRLIVLGANEINFLSSNPVRRVVLGEPNPLPQCTTLSALSSVVRNTQSQRYAAVLRGVLVSGTEEKAERQERAALAQDADAAIQQNGNGRHLGQAAGQQDAEIEFLSEKERLEAQKEAKEREEQACPAIFEENPRLLQFALEHVVSITGSVRRPAVLPVAGTVNLDDLVALAGGLSRDADSTQVEVIDFARRGSGSPHTDRQVFDMSDTATADILVAPGSGVQVRTKIENQEMGGILLSGEFKHPGVYIIARGEKLSRVIARAGGLTDQAYPYGAIFTRRSVKEAQQEGFRRTARELNAALVSAALKNNADGEAIEAVRQLAQTAETIEAPGRVVIEADPRVLALRPDLDPMVEPGDTLLMPKRPSHVLALGDVLNPGALQFVRGKTVASYVSEAGGAQASADRGRMFLVYPNGVAQPVNVSAWTRERYMVPPGSTIIVPKDTEPLAGLQLTREIVTILSQLTLSAASIAVISR